MENASLTGDVWDNLTTNSSAVDGTQPYVALIRHVGLKVSYILIGALGVLDNLFVIIVFALFIKITDKVLPILKHYST